LWPEKLNLWLPYSICCSRHRPLSSRQPFLLWTRPSFIRPFCGSSATNITKWRQGVGCSTQFRKWMFAIRKFGTFFCYSIVFLYPVNFFAVFSLFLSFHILKVQGISHLASQITAKAVFVTCESEWTLCRERERLKLFLCLTEYQGRTIPQDVSPRLPTAAARVPAQVRPCGICGGQSGSGADFSEYFGFTCQFSFHLSLHIHYHHHPLKKLN
jgi:hypothetical protein